MKKTIGVLVGGVVLVLGFQNCSKIGTSGIAVQDKAGALGLVPDTSSQISNDTDPAELTVVDDGKDDDVAVNPNGPSVVPSVPNVPVTGSSPVPNTPAPSPEDDEPKRCANRDHRPNQADEVISITKEDIDNAVAMCAEKKAGVEVVKNLKLKFNRKNSLIDITAFDVIKVRGNHGKMVVIRASDASSTAKNLHFNHSTVVLCNFKEISKIHAVHSNLIVVGGVVDKLKLTHSEFHPVGGATVLKNSQDK